MMQDSPLEAYLDFIRSALQSVGRIFVQRRDNQIDV